MRKNGTLTIVDTPKAREYKKQVDAFLRENYGNVRFDGKVAIGYHFFLATNGRQDCTNMAQGIEDAFQRVGIMDDDTWQKCSVAYADGFPCATKEEERSEVMIFSDN